MPPPDQSMGNFSFAPWNEGFGDNYKVYFQPPAVAMVVPLDTPLHTKSPQALVRRLARDMARQYESMLEHHLAQMMLKIGVVPAHSPYALAPHQAEMLHYSKLDAEKTMKLMAQLGLPVTGEASIPPVVVDEALGFDPAQPPPAKGVVEELAEVIPGFKGMKQTCPVKDCDRPAMKMAGSLLYHVIMHLNDDHEWTREAIADWLETTNHDLQFKAPEGGEKDGDSN